MNILITSNHRLESLLEKELCRLSNGVLVVSQEDSVFFNINYGLAAMELSNGIRIVGCESTTDATQKFSALLDGEPAGEFFVDPQGLPAWCVQALLDRGWQGKLHTLWNPWIFTHSPKKAVYERVFRVCQSAQLYLLSLVSENRYRDPQEWAYDVQRYLQSHVESRFGQVVGVYECGGVLSYEFVVSKLGVQSYLSGSIILGKMEVELQRWGVETLKEFEDAVRYLQKGMTSAIVEEQVGKSLPTGSIVKIEPLWSKTLWLEGQEFSLENEGAYYIQAWVNIKDRSTGVLRMSNVVRVDQNRCDFEYVFLPEMIHVP